MYVSGIKRTKNNALSVLCFECLIIYLCLIPYMEISCYKEFFFVSNLRYLSYKKRLLLNKVLKNYDHCILLNFTLRSIAHYFPTSFGIVLVSLNPSRKYKSNSSLSVNPFKNVSTLTVSSSLQKKEKKKKKKKRKHKRKQKKKKTN